MATFGDYIKASAQLPHADAPDTVQDSHRKAADVHERAYHHHREAARLHEKGDHQQAGVHATIALGHAHAARQIEVLIVNWQGPG